MAAKWLMELRKYVILASRIQFFKFFKAGNILKKCFWRWKNYFCRLNVEFGYLFLNTLSREYKEVDLSN